MKYFVCNEWMSLFWWIKEIKHLGNLLCRQTLKTSTLSMYLCRFFAFILCGFKWPVFHRHLYVGHILCQPHDKCWQYWNFNEAFRDKPKRVMFVQYRQMNYVCMNNARSGGKMLVLHLLIIFGVLLSSCHQPYCILGNQFSNTEANGNTILRKTEKRQDW